ncbi:hypothetical protein CaCOL14_006112 [Colletotrichum acutatum]|uniref:FAD-binding domain-containing protein n=1 Tax=Glomerella acutata TaxID=27357 RepID=A0AAD8XBE1_GLOAC|nr:uncharacterized protein BDZ83DRAFT_632180 [Colletotrichum acutatum]KAK1719425.1 hypothetical protein BDZ83DRAFT_632180 [Colletotrichum acutatum]
MMLFSKPIRRLHLRLELVLDYCPTACGFSTSLAVTTYEAYRAKAEDSVSQHFYLRRENGEILDYQHNLMDTWEKMLGHPMICIDRQMLIQVLYENLKHKDRVLSSERVVSVDFTDSRAHVTTKDSKVFGGDIVVGADGIRSTVRKEMWREAPTGYFPLGRGIKGPRLGSVCLWYLPQTRRMPRS